MNWIRREEGVAVVEGLGVRSWPWDVAFAEAEADGTWSSRLHSSFSDYEDITLGRYRTEERAKNAATSAVGNLAVLDVDRSAIAGWDDLGVITLVSRGVTTQSTEVTDETVSRPGE